MPKRKSLSIVVVMLLVACGGCGGKYKTYKVTGQVTLRDGTPVSGVRVTFDRSDHKMSATARTDTEGRFELTTLDTDDGAPTGTYDVMITVPQMRDPDKPTPTLFHPKYSDPRTSGLRFEVGEQSEHFEIVLDPPPRV